MQNLTLIVISVQQNVTYPQPVFIKDISLHSMLAGCCNSELHNGLCFYFNCLTSSEIPSCTGFPLNLYKLSKSRQDKGALLFGFLVVDVRKKVNKAVCIFLGNGKLFCKV